MSAEHVALIDRLRGLSRETEWLELKRNRYEPQVLGEYLSALANSAALPRSRAATSCSASTMRSTP
jgi:ATP-dependent DNA helicase RecG